MTELTPGGGASIVVTAGVALLLDLALGDPPGRWHPVAWMGTLLGRARSAAPTGAPFRMSAPTRRASAMNRAYSQRLGAAASSMRMDTAVSRPSKVRGGPK